MHVRNSQYWEVRGYHTYARRGEEVDAEKAPKTPRQGQLGVPRISDVPISFVCSFGLPPAPGSVVPESSLGRPFSRGLLAS